MAIKFGLSAWQEYVPRGDPNAPIVLCFGDSWFQYPIPGIGNLSFNLLQFGKHQAIDIVALGNNGMEIANPGKRLLADLQFFLQWESKTVDMIAISGGGNDFAGANDLDPLLKKGKNGNPASWFKTKETDELFEIFHGWLSKTSLSQRHFLSYSAYSDSLLRLCTCFRQGSFLVLSLDQTIF